MIAVVNRLPVKEGMADQVVERFADGRGFVQEFPGFVSMEVLRSEGADEVMVITRWRDREAFDSWVHSDEFRMVHGRSGGSGMLRGHPQMGTYEIAAKREPEQPRA
jgi:heme-degrading monooxygenase HmoA